MTVLLPIARYKKVKMMVDGYSILNNTSLDPVLGSPHTFIRSILLLYNTAVIVVGLGGNCLVLYGSIKHSAILMDKVSVLLLETIAVADLCATLLQYIPMMVTLAAERWVFGRVLCYCAVFRYIPFAAEAMLIALMSCHRVRVLAYPLRGHISVGGMRKVLVGVWVFYLVSVPCITGIKPVIKYTPSHLHCSSFDWENMAHVPSYLRAMRLVSGLYLAIPALITIIANVAILTIVLNVSKRSLTCSSGMKAVKTVSIICWVFVASYVPTVIIFALPALGVAGIPQWVNCFSMYSVSLNLIANPFIYSFTNSKFSLYVKLACSGKIDNFARQWIILNSSG